MEIFTSGVAREVVGAERDNLAITVERINSIKFD
jgi:hypothetical protein